MGKATEVWKPVVGLESNYEVSNLGRVRSLPRVRMAKWWDGNEERTREIRIGSGPHILKPKRGVNDYAEVCLSANNVQRSARVHRLVLEAFVGPAPQGAQCAHMNGKPTDNRLTNLAWVTAAVNASHKKIHGTDNYAQGPRQRVLEKAEAAKILGPFMSVETIARCLSLKPSTVTRWLAA